MYKMKKLIAAFLVWGALSSYVFAGGNPPIQGWTNLGSGVNGEVNSIIEYNGDIYAGGEFTIAGGNCISFIARRDGSKWSSLCSGVDGLLYVSHVNNAIVYTGVD